MAKKNQPVEVNEFDQTIAASKTFYDNHKNAILYGGGSVLAVIILSLLLHQLWWQPRLKAASESMFAAEQLFQAGEYDKALNGEGETLGFLAVADKYSYTKAANLSRLYAAICYAQTEKYDEAAAMLKKFSACGDEMVSPSAKGMLGNLYVQLGETEKGAKLLEDAAHKADNNTVSPIYLLQAGQVYESLDQKDKALKCYETIKAKYVSSMQAASIDKYIERVK